MNEMDEAIESRLAHLERSCRLWRAVGVLAMVGLATLSAWPLVAPKPKSSTVASTVAPTEELRAEKFVVVDAAGKTRAEFGMTEGQPAFRMNFKDGIAAVEIGMSHDEAASGLVVFGRDAQGLVQAQVRDGEPFVEIRGPKLSEPKSLR